MEPSWHKSNFPFAEVEGAVIRLSPSPGTIGADAEAFLRRELARGPQYGTDLRRAAAEAGFAWSTVKDARYRVGVVCVRVAASGGSRRTIWRLEDPAVDPPRVRTKREPRISPISGSLIPRGTGARVDIKYGTGRVRTFYVTDAEAEELAAIGRPVVRRRYTKKSFSTETTEAAAEQRSPGLRSASMCTTKRRR